MAPIGRAGRIPAFRSGNRQLLACTTRRAIAYAAPAIQEYEYPSEQHIPLPSSRREAIKNAKPFSSFLTDTFQREHDYLRISITEKCNLRCLYCMPEEGVPQSPPAHLLTTPEIYLLSSVFVSQGVTKIRLTGGEPTVRRDILPMMHQLGSLRSQGLRELCLTTNGISLHRKLDSMVEAGLTGVNLSLDTLDSWQFQIMTRRKGFEAVMKSIERILEMNKLGAGIKLKINCVVMRGMNEREIIPFVELGREQDLEVRFIEYMPFDGNKWSQGKMLSYQEMLDKIRAKYPGLRKVQDHKNDTSKTYQIPGFVGRMGFITSMTHNFCGTCNRLRITSDGNLKVCLFGNAEVSLRDILRKSNDGQPIDEQAFEAMKQIEMDRRQGLSSSQGPLGGSAREKELLEVIGMAVSRKKEKHAGMGELENMKNRPMILIDENPRKRPKIDMPRRPTTLVGSSTPAWQKIPYHLLGPASGATSVRLYTTSSESEPESQAKDEELIDETKEKAEPTESEEDIAADRSTVDPLHAETTPTAISTEETAENEAHARTEDTTEKKAPGRAEEEASAPVSIGIVQLAKEHEQNMMALNASLASKAEETRSSNSKSPLSKTRKLTHLNHQGNAHMVSIHNKDVTSRTAVAVCYIYFSNPTTPLLISHNLNKKGDVLGVARVAGIMAAKKCSEIIPLCHPVMLSRVELDLDVHDKGKREWKSVGEGLDRKLVPVYKEGEQNGRHAGFGCVAIKATVSCDGQTGVEMEALTAASTAALTVYDMCKGVDKGMKIGGLKVLRKEGGQSGTWVDGKKEAVVKRKPASVLIAELSRKAEEAGLNEEEASVLAAMKAEAETRATRQMEAAGFRRGPL